MTLQQTNRKTYYGQEPINSIADKLTRLDRTEVDLIKVRDAIRLANPEQQKLGEPIALFSCTSQQYHAMLETEMESVNQHRRNMRWYGGSHHSRNFAESAIPITAESTFLVASFPPPSETPEAFKHVVIHQDGNASLIIFQLSYNQGTGGSDYVKTTPPKFIVKNLNKLDASIIQDILPR